MGNENGCESVGSIAKRMLETAHQNLQTPIGVQRLVDEVAEIEARGVEDEYYRRVAGWKFKIQYRFTFFDLAMRTPPPDVYADREGEVHAVIDRLVADIKADKDCKEKYELRFSDETSAGWAVEDREYRSKRQRKFRKGVEGQVRPLRGKAQ